MFESPLQFYTPDIWKGFRVFNGGLESKQIVNIMWLVSQNIENLPCQPFLEYIAHGAATLTSFKIFLLMQMEEMLFSWSMKLMLQAWLM